MNAKNNSPKQPNLLRWLLILLAVSAVVSVFYNQLNIRQEHCNRLAFAKELLNDDDTKGLQLFETWCKEIQSDSLISDEKTDENLKLEHIRKVFDSAFLENYT
jgi:hypothetical protein